ncbi:MULTISPECIES: nucleotidyltransferase domain-containing protein [unclassified Sphingobacterium]|uniref:nucleotidyltransferase domain-containing protein n=1 Tax=unclassified Sphingobacterium TaxID=2609468 RepID=UPI0025F2C70A|nr:MULTISPECIES: nucleotidyltransferase [unclassified Sphingobacterium]
MIGKLTSQQKLQFNNILEELGRNLDISESQHNAISKSYDAVGLHLAKHDSLLGKYAPEILPQGSFMLGTMIQPVHENDDLDIDLVCQLVGKQESWTQYDLKQAVGDQLKAHGTYKRMLKSPEGRRCWTLVYSEDANYHLDILPCIVDSGYRVLLEKAFSDNEMEEANGLALRITDNLEPNYKSEANHLNWMKSNPFGYANWFFNQASLELSKSALLLESIQPVPKYSKDKLPLQRVIQILKRHRDMMFDGDIDKPISILITTLASKAYEKETDILEALVNITQKMAGLVTEEYSKKHGRYIKWVENPVNPEENFADKWADYPKREQNFYKWIIQVQSDMEEVLGLTGLHRIQESFSKSLGAPLLEKTFNSIADNARLLTEEGKSRLDVNVGITALGAAAIKPHTFYGK